MRERKHYQDSRWQSSKHKHTPVAWWQWQPRLPGLHSCRWQQTGVRRRCLGECLWPGSQLSPSLRLSGTVWWDLCGGRQRGGHFTWPVDNIQQAEYVSQIKLWKMSESCKLSSLMGTIWQRIAQDSQMWRSMLRPSHNHRHWMHNDGDDDDDGSQVSKVIVLEYTLLTTQHLHILIERVTKDWHIYATQDHILLRIGWFLFHPFCVCMNATILESFSTVKWDETEHCHLSVSHTHTFGRN